MTEMRALVVALAIAITCLASPASADEASKRQRALILAGEAAEDVPDPARATKLYTEVLRVDDGSRLARRAKARLRWLRARSEGDFGPLTALMAIRKRTTTSLSSEDVAGFEERALAFPSGLVRRESLALVAETYARLDEHDAAIAAYEAWRNSPGVTEGEHRRITYGVALVNKARGHTGDALAQLEAVDLGHHPEAVHARQQQLASRLRPVALAVYLLFLAVGLGLGGWRGLRAPVAAFRPVRLGLVAWAFGVPTLMMFAYDVDVGPKFALVAGAGAITVLLAAAFSEGLRRSEASPARRRGLAALAAVAAIAGCFLAFAHSTLMFDVMLGWKVLEVIAR